MNAADTVLRGIATTIMWRKSWFHSSGFPRNIQSTMEDLPFDKANFFSRLLYTGCKEETNYKQVYRQRQPSQLFYHPCPYKPLHKCLEGTETQVRSFLHIYCSSSTPSVA